MEPIVTQCLLYGVRITVLCVLLHCSTVLGCTLLYRSFCTFGLLLIALNDSSVLFSVSSRYLLVVRQRRRGGSSEEWRGLDTLLLRLLLECAPPELVLRFVSLPNDCLLVSFP